MKSYTALLFRHGLGLFVDYKSIMTLFALKGCQLFWIDFKCFMYLNPGI